MPTTDSRPHRLPLCLWHAGLPIGQKLLEATCDTLTKISLFCIFQVRRDQ